MITAPWSQVSALLSHRPAVFAYSRRSTVSVPCHGTIAISPPVANGPCRTALAWEMGRFLSTVCSVYLLRLAIAVFFAAGAIFPNLPLQRLQQNPTCSPSNSTKTFAVWSVWKMHRSAMPMEFRVAQLPRRTAITTRASSLLMGFGWVGGRGWTPDLRDAGTLDLFGGAEFRAECSNSV